MKNLKYKNKYDDFLNECYPEIKIEGLTFRPSQILKEVDPIAYNDCYNDFLNTENLSEDGSDDE